MDSAPFSEELSERKVCVVGSELVENYTVYIIDVTDGRHRWTVKHRYSDFHDLHEKLVAEKKVDRRLLPPKKILGKNSKSLVERRQKDLELYLQTLLLQFPQATPTALACFLHFHLYEINGITAALAEELFHKGEQLLQAGEVFCLRPLQLYSVSQQLRLAKPTCCNGDARTDLGHILDFTCRLRYLKICGSRGPVGSSNIQESSLPFDLSVFKSLLQIQISDCSSEQIEGLSTLRTSLETMNVHQSTQSMMSVLVPEAAEFPQWEPEGAESVCPVTALVPVWRQLTTLDLSHNDISCIDTSVRLIPKVEFLDLSSNQLSLVENLQHLYNLVHVDLSYNNLQVLEAAHTRLGNIKTLNLAGNQLHNLSGLSKLYSLVNLDLSHNQLDQLEEIRNIGSLPCLEKLNLAANPMCIIPDYRTKVLAQFGDRAAEVCLDSRVTTEKELDTVEVLKAIQKAKEVKDRMSSGDKKTSEDTRPPAAPLLCSSSSPLSSSAPPASSSSCPTQQTSSQEVTSPVDAAAPPTVLPPVDATTPPASFNPLHLSAGPAQVQQSAVSLSELCGASTDVPAADITVCSTCSSSSSRPVHITCSSCSAPWCLLLPAHLLLLSASNQDFVTQLSQRLVSAHRKQRLEEEEKPGSGELLQPAGDGMELDSLSPGSRDGYFEMGLGDSLEEVFCSSSVGLQRAPSEEQQQQQQQEEEEVRVSRVLWCCCVLAEPQDVLVEPQEELKQREACLVLTQHLLGLLFLSPDSTGTNQDAEQNQSGSMAEVLSRLQVDLLVPYFQLQLSSPDQLPDSCLGFGLRAGPTRWYIFSEAQQLRQTRTELTALIQVQTVQVQSDPELPQLIPPSLISSWELEESRGAQGGFAAHLLTSSGPNAHLVLSRVSPRGPPVLLFLTRRHFWVLEMDLRQLAEKERSGSDLGGASWCRLVRLPLGSVVLHPSERESELRNRTCPDPQHLHRRHHCVDLLLADQRLLLLFPLAQDRSSFLGELSQRRASLEGMKVVALPRPCRSCRQQGHLLTGCCRCCSSSRRSNSCSSWNSSRLQVEENHPSPHLLPGLSPGLKLLAGLGGQQLLGYFHRFIALSELEDLKQVLWLSVVLYKSPEAELTCCLLLSTDHIYFLLEDSASTLTHHSVLDVSDAGDPDSILVCCLSISLSELLAVNVGLFDQYFRVVGGSADHIVCCLSRDSYGTGVFLQELMAALSLQQQLPPPEPSDQDFYSQFTHTCSGKMQNYELVHSSQVKFIYPSEEEMGDLTFIVAERKTPASCSRSFNVLLYLLVFQVQVPSSQSSGPSAILQPRTLILTSTDIFLLDEDYVSYPLPDFAKEPPSRERYQLREARRIRDLDRVLLGYQTYPQALTLVFDDLPGPDLLCHLTMDHFAAAGEEAPPRGGGASRGAEGEVQWCVFVPGGDSRERLISLLARQWEALCSRELPVELTG